MYYTLLGPVAFALVTNFTVFVIILRSLATRNVNSATKPGSRKDWTELKRQVRSAFTISVLLGLSWVFALLAVGDAREVFQWLFTVLNSTQGFVIFVLYTVRNTEIRKQVNGWFRCFCDHRNDTNLNSTSSITPRGELIASSSVSMTTEMTTLKR